MKNNNEMIKCGGTFLICGAAAILFKWECKWDSIWRRQACWPIAGHFLKAIEKFIYAYSFRSFAILWSLVQPWTTWENGISNWIECTTKAITGCHFTDRDAQQSADKPDGRCQSELWSCQVLSCFTLNANWLTIKLWFNVNGWSDA